MKRIGFLPMKRCNLRCFHCQKWLGCNPESKEENWNRVKNIYLPEAGALGFDWIGFSGGELTLEMNHLLECIKIAHKMGAITSLVTNGWWGKDKKMAGDICNNLKLAGLDILKISFDSFHAEFLSREIVLQAMEIAQTFRFELHAYCIIDDLKENDRELLASKYLFQETPLWNRVTSSFDCSFKKIPIVLWNNKVFSSCDGLSIGITSNEYLGDLTTTTLKDIFKNILKSPG